MKLISTEEDKYTSMPFVIMIIGAIVIGLVGVYLRFADFRYSSQIADVIFGIAVIMVFKAVFDWMKG